MEVWTNQTKDASTFLNMGQSGIAKWGDLVAKWGDAVTQWGTDTRATWTDNTKHTSTFTNQTKN